MSEKNSAYGVQKRDKLERFCIENSLVLAGELARWRNESLEDVSFEELCIIRHSAINESHWMDKMCANFIGLHVIPMPQNIKVCNHIENQNYAECYSQTGCIILQNEPVLIVGIVDPFKIEQVSDFLNQKIPGKLRHIVLISPHYFSKAAALVEAGVSDFTGEWGEEYIEWCENIGFDSVTFLDEKSVIEELWNKHKIPVIPPLQYDECFLLQDLDSVILKKTNLNIWVATTRPLSENIKDSLMQRLGLGVHILSVGPSEMRRIVALSKEEKYKEIFKTDSPLHVSEWLQTNDGELFMSILTAAIKMKASDIHFDPKPEKVRVRFRVDGVLMQQAPIGTHVYNGVLRKLKIQGRMMQDVQGEFQDGAGWISVDGERFDLRISVSVLNGGEEAAVVRIFNSSIPSIDALKLPLMESRVLRWFLSQTQGMAIASGPTGSGKTTLLYALLKSLNTPEVSIVTIEQPVEKYFEDAKQITVFEKGKITFDSALRNVLRQDPDVIMVGEIRDVDSCKIAVQAAQTGHLVLSTVHANEATGIVQRMTDAFKVERVSVASAIKLAIAQRLVPRLCPYCKHEREPRAEDIENFPQISIANPVIAEKVGCSACKNTGTLGRHLVMEMLPFDETVVSMICSGRTPDEIARYNKNRGYRPLLDQATELLLTGEIDVMSASQFINKPLV